VSGEHPGEVRAARVAEQLRERQLDLLLVSAPANVRYLTGFTGTSGAALIAAEGDHTFLTDFRYETQSAEQVPGTFKRKIVSAELLEALVGLLANGEGSRGGGPDRSLGFDDAHISVKQYERLRQALGADRALVGCAGLVEALREVKEEEEVARIRAAAELADAALLEVIEEGIVGRTERDVALELELRMRRLGASSPSFPSIVAAGAHGALPHAEPRDVAIPAGVLVTIDWGAVLDGYCSDCTRTYATGELAGSARAVYELVLSAQLAALEALRAGPSGREVDAVARAVIERSGQGEHFGHGLGHGVGIEIHESPRLSRTAPERPLVPGNIVTIEPGVYLPGALGVRIEDLALVTADGHETLSGLPKELTIVE
jgi:Xaa-Pro aminopeptidase